MTLVRSVLLVLLFIVPVLAQDANESREQRRERNFTQRDTNKDGRISREEFSGNAANFDRRDSNKDGFISREEFGLNPTPPEREYTEEEQRLMAGDNENSSLAEGVKPVSIPLSISPVHELRTPSGDGATAEASYRVPPGDGPFPAIVFMHGGLGYQNQERRQQNLTGGPIQTRFLTLGYVTVQATRRDYTDNPQAEGPILDFLAIVEAVRKLDQVDSESIVVMGGSGGGSMTLDLISRTSVSAAVAGEPASIIFAGMLTKPAANQAVRYEPINDPAKFWTPDIIAKVQGKVSRFQTPLLVLHGDVHPLKHVNMDYIIPAIRDGGKTIEVKIYPGKDHGFYWGRQVDEAFVVAMIEDIHSFAVPLLKTKPVLMDQKFYSKK